MLLISAYDEQVGPTASVVIVLMEAELEVGAVYEKVVGATSPWRIVAEPNSALFATVDFANCESWAAADLLMNRR